MTHIGWVFRGVVGARASQSGRVANTHVCISVGKEYKRGLTHMAAQGWLLHPAEVCGNTLLCSSMPMDQQNPHTHIQVSYKRLSILSIPDPLLLALAKFSLATDNEMQTNHCAKTSQHDGKECRFMGAKWKYYQNYDFADGMLGV